MCKRKKALNVRHIREQVNSVPYPVSRGRWDVDGQSARQLQDLDAEHQRHVGHLGYLLPDVLVLGGFLEVLGLCDLVYKSQDLPACAATSVPGLGQENATKFHVSECVACLSVCFLTF